MYDLMDDAPRFSREWWSDTAQIVGLWGGLVALAGGGIALNDYITKKNSERFSATDADGAHGITLVCDKRDNTCFIEAPVNQETKPPYRITDNAGRVFNVACQPEFLTTNMDGKDLYAVKCRKTLAADQAAVKVTSSPAP